MATHKAIEKRKVYLDNIHVSEKRMYAEIREVGTKAPIVCASLWFCAQWLNAALENDKVIVVQK